MTRTLELGHDFSVPLDVLTSAIGVIGVRGSGKTTTAGVLVEEAIGAGVPCVITDPTGAWYGLKSSADGKNAGLPVYVFGGEHADVPLEPDSAKIVARFVVEKRVPVVLDLSLMSKGQQIRFVADFHEDVYHRNREPLLVVVDETGRMSAELTAAPRQVEIIIGKPCRACGNQERYASSTHNCVRCARKRSKKVNDEKNATHPERSQVFKDAAYEARRKEAETLYAAGYTVEKIAELLGVHRGTVHALLNASGVRSYRDRPWTSLEDSLLRELYVPDGEFYPDTKQIAKTLKRSAAAVKCRAAAIGAALPEGLRMRDEQRAQSGATISLVWSFKGHPRGMLGKKHSAESRAKMSASRTGKPHNVTFSRDRREALSKRAAEQLAGTNVYSRCKSGRRADLNNQFFRSAWEANVARWLNYLGIAWQYEPKTFWFDKIRRGARSYLPDFFLIRENVYLEVKGWMDAKSATKLKRMAKYYPHVQIQVIDRKRYLELSSYAAVIPEWEK